MVLITNIINGVLSLLASKAITTKTTSTIGKASSTSIKAANTIAVAVTTNAAVSAASTLLTSTKAGSTLLASSTSRAATNINVVASEAVNANNVVATTTPTSVPVIPVVINGATVDTNTTVATNVTISANITGSATTLSSTILVIARDDASAYNAYSGLNAYRIPYQVLIVPKEGTALPALNGSATAGSFGAIVVVSEVSYDYGGTIGFTSALTTDQWATIYTYQLLFGVRMARMDVYPGPSSGTTAIGGCCGAGQEQTISISNDTGFPTAGLRTGATMSTIGLYHYPATITDASIAVEFAQFGTTTGYDSPSTAGVINKIDGREQMVFFTSFATDWSDTSNFLQHTWIHWTTRGLFTGFRRVYFGTQVDDMFLSSTIYYPKGQDFRIRTEDLNGIKSWMTTLNAKLNPGSNYIMEVGHNGNGNIEQSTATDTTGELCTGGPIEYNEQIDTLLEFQKVPGTGANIWVPPAPQYPYSVACTKADPLLIWWTTPANRDAFAHISHTFTHEDENNATFSDVNYEISWNQAWIKQIGLDQAAHWSPKGLIPPAITGLHNGDALRAWAANGITNCVGDNTRAPLLNKQNEHWPYITTVATDGYDGIQVTPRWASRIYYNCDTAACTVQEWIDTSAGVGDINTLLGLERQSSARHLLGLRHDQYMFHQANLRNIDVTSTTINGVTKQLSLISMWVETVAQEMVRLVKWPMISLTHDKLAVTFAERMAADKCIPKMSYTINPVTKLITGVTLTTTGNTCSAPIPVTVPTSVTDTLGFKTEKVGSDPLTIWVTMSGSPVSFTLSTPIAL